MSCVLTEWKQISRASAAVALFRRQALRKSEREKPLRFVMDIQSDIADRA